MIGGIKWLKSDQITEEPWLLCTARLSTQKSAKQDHWSNTFRKLMNRFGSAWETRIYTDYFSGRTDQVVVE